MAVSRAKPVGRIFGYALSAFGYDLTSTWAIDGKVCGGLAFLPTWSIDWLWHTRITPFTLSSLVLGAAHLCALADQHKADYDGPDSDPLLGKLAPLFFRRLVTEVIVRRRLPDEAQRSAGQLDVREAAIICFSQSSLNDHSRSVVSTVMRHLQTQQHDQIDYVYFTIETHLIKEIMQQASIIGVNLDKLYLFRFGLTFDQLFLLSFATYATALRRPGFIFTRIRYWTDSDFVISQEQWERFLDEMSLDFNTFQQRGLDRNVRVTGYETYALSPLKRWPLVEIASGRYVLPIPRDALERMHFGFLFDMRDAGLSGKDEGLVHDVRGEVYETFTGRCLRFAAAGQEVMRVDEVLKKSVGKRCDWIVVDDHSVTGLEVKNKHFGLAADMTKEDVYIKAELAKKGGIADAIFQIEATFNQLAMNGTVSARSLTSKYGVVVVHGEQVMLNFGSIRTLISEVYEDRAGKAGPEIRYYIINDLALVALTFMLKRGYRLAGFLHWVFASSSRLELEAHRAIAQFAGLDNMPPEKHPMWEEMQDTIDKAHNAFTL